jgi:phosphopantothenoylcysteine decarboxylase/phosphopantothenate--cysteine ligase
MNTNMWEHPAVKANVETLAARGVRFVDPGDGYLACGWVGKGRLAEPVDVVEAAERLLGGRATLAGRRVVVTAGPTAEDIDPVRFIGNRSSGRMGFALAAEARDRGASVVLIVGPTPVPPPGGVEIVRVRSARDMHAAVFEHASGADAIIMAAAVADYMPSAGAAHEKLEKQRTLTLALERTPDILAELGAYRADARKPVLVGFAAQTGDPVPAARRKLRDKRVDLIVANDVTAPGAGFEVDTNQVTLVSAEAVEALPILSKSETAGRVLDRLERILAAPHRDAVTS